jgi:hypothetical protein
MLRTSDAAAAIRLGLCIVHDVGAQHGFPWCEWACTPARRWSATATGSGQRSTWRPGWSAAASGGDSSLSREGLALGFPISEEA